MPTYEYLCSACGHTFEQVQSILAKPLRKCPKCGKSVKRLIGGGGGIIFKGTGFYQTDYRSKSYSDGAQKDKPASDSTSTKKNSSEKKSPGKE